MHKMLVAKGNSNVFINSSTTDYQLHGSSLTIATFTPLVESLVCRIQVVGVPPFQGNNIVTQTGFLINIGVLEGTYHSGGSRGESGASSPSRSKIIKIHGIIIGSHSCNATFDSTSGLALQTLSFACI